MIHIIVDGYNFIRQVPELMRHEKISLEQGRNQLVSILSRYKKIKRHKITVVFDGVLNLSEFAPAFKQAGIQICFSPQGVSADDVIKGMVREEGQRALVVSSDHSILNEARIRGSSTLSSPEFYDKICMAVFVGDVEKNEGQRRSPQHKRWLTYKKGPSKKRSKKERRHSQRLNKL